MPLKIYFLVIVPYKNISESRAFHQKTKNLIHVQTNSNSIPIFIHDSAHGLRIILIYDKLVLEIIIFTSEPIKTA